MTTATNDYPLRADRLTAFRYGRFPDEFPNQLAAISDQAISAQRVVFGKRR